MKPDSSGEIMRIMRISPCDRKGHICGVRGTLDTLDTPESGGEGEVMMLCIL
jgi:hypothetical protein